MELARAPVFLERPEAQGSYHLTRLSFHVYPDSAAALAAYRNGAVNALANVATRARLLALPGGRVYTQVAPTIAMLIFNWNEARFAERRVRQALSLSLDAPELLRKHLGDAVTYADSPFTPGSSVYMPHDFWHSHDIAQARALLDAAGILPAGDDDSDSDIDGDDVDAADALLSLLIEDTGPLRSLAGDVASQWARLGFDVHIDAASAEDLTNRLQTGRFQAAIVELPVGGDFDLYRYWHPAQYGGGRNYGAAADHEVADLIEGARREIYPNRRAALQQQLQAAFAEQAIAIPLYYPLYTFVVSDQLAGIQLGYLASGADRFRGIGDWRLSAGPS